MVVSFCFLEALASCKSLFHLSMFSLKVFLQVCWKLFRSVVCRAAMSACIFFTAKEQHSNFFSPSFSCFCTTQPGGSCSVIILAEIVEIQRKYYCFWMWALNITSTVKTFGESQPHKYLARVAKRQQHRHLNLYWKSQWSVNKDFLSQFWSSLATKIYLHSFFWFFNNNDQLSLWSCLAT